MPKQKCRANRKARKKRDKKLLARIVHKNCDGAVLKAKGQSPAFYEVRYTSVRTMVRAGRRFIDLRKLKCVTVPNAAYRRMMAELLAMIPADLMVTIPQKG